MAMHTVNVSPLNSLSRLGDAIEIPLILWQACVLLFFVIDIHCYSTDEQVVVTQL